jgi:transposase-like protein
MEADLLAPQLTSADAAREYLEARRWPDGPVCPHCGIVGEATRLEPKQGAETHARKGLLKCRACEKQFSVTVGTIFEDSHIPLNKWLLAYHLMSAGKKGISAHQLHRMLGISYKASWFMCHRIRYTMNEEPVKGLLAGVVEVDETYVGGKEKYVPGVASKKTPVIALLQRGGEVRSMPMERVTVATLKPLLKAHIDAGANLMTDDSTVYRWPKAHFDQHDRVKHIAGEYARHEPGKPTITTNTVEGFFALLKRGNYGTFHHWDRKYMQQYLNEFNFRYNARKITDAERAKLALKGVEGKRLMLREPKGIV